MGRREGGGVADSLMYECRGETCRPAKDCAFLIQAQKNCSLKNHGLNFIVLSEFS